MKDRVPTYPGRVQLTPVPGQANTYDMVRADAPTQEGDALCKANLLPDDVATALGLSGNPQVKDALGTVDVILTGAADPTTATVAVKVGQRYLNTTNGTLWYCSAISSGAYTWNLIAGKVPSATATAFNLGSGADIIKILTAIASAGGWDILNATGSTVVPISRGGTGFSHALVQFGHFSSSSLTFSFPVDFVILTFGYTTGTAGMVWLCDMRLRYPMMVQLAGQVAVNSGMESITSPTSAASVNSTRTTLSWTGNTYYMPPVSGNQISEYYNYYAFSLIA